MSLKISESEGKFKKFKKKGKYCIPWIVFGNNGSNDYKIIFPLDFKDLIKDKVYYVDFHLLKKFSNIFARKY